MSSVVDFKYDTDIISNIKEWTYGTNWPAVYIFYNDTFAYVGETLDAVKRTKQHMDEKEFDDFSRVCFISNKTFNKSVILDLESFLIKYMGAEGTKKLTNGNAGVLDHAYFYREAYEDDFREIWQLLISLGIVKQSLIDVENSSLFKYSPFKSLTSEQQTASHEILKRICEIDNASAQSIVEVIGGAGTGKTILAVYLIKLLTDIRNNREVWKSIDDIEDADRIKKLAGKLKSIQKVGFVVPMKKLRDTMRDIFGTIEGLSKEMVLAPEDVVKEYYDVLIVDEAHRLYQRRNLPGAELYVKFDKINKQIMAEKFTGSADDYTELDWIINSSRIQILFYDVKQSIRKPDIGKQRFEKICSPHLYKYVELFSQMRCKGGNGYYDYVKEILESTDMDINRHRVVQNYSVSVLDCIDKLFDVIKEDNAKSGLSRVVSGPGWTIGDDISIEDKVYKWVSDKDDVGKIYSIHKIQGFDLNYAGVIFGKEIYYDKEKKRIEINRAELGDNFVKEDDAELTRQYVLNIYLTLMSRGIYGTFIYAVDKDLRDYLSLFLN